MSRTLWLVLVVAAVIPIVGIVILNLENFGLSLNLSKKEIAPVSISPTSTPKIKFISQSSCVVLDEIYCKTGKVVNYQGKFFGLGFNLPEGTKIYAPFNGVTGNSRAYTLDKKQYPSITVDFQLLPQADQENISFSVIAFIKNVSSNNKVEQGEEVGQASGKPINIFSDYNLILNFERFNPKTKLLETDFDLFKKYFNYVQN